MKDTIFRLGTHGTELGLYDSLDTAVKAYARLRDKHSEDIADIIEDEEEQPYIEEQIIERSDEIARMHGPDMYRLIERAAKYDTDGNRI